MGKVFTSLCDVSWRVMRFVLCTYHVGGIQFDRHGLPDQLNAENEAGTGAFAEEDPLKADKRTTDDLYPVPLLQIGVRIVRERAGDEATDALDLGLGDGDRARMIPENLYNAMGS